MNCIAVRVLFYTCGLAVLLSPWMYYRVAQTDSRRHIIVPTVRSNTGYNSILRDESNIKNRPKSMNDSDIKYSPIPTEEPYMKNKPMSMTDSNLGENPVPTTDPYNKSNSIKNNPTLMNDSDIKNNPTPMKDLEMMNDPDIKNDPMPMNDLEMMNDPDIKNNPTPMNDLEMMNDPDIKNNPTPMNDLEMMNDPDIKNNPTSMNDPEISNSSVSMNASNIKNQRVDIIDTGYASTGTKRNASCVEKRHLVFLKVPKAGSSTVQNIFYRFGTTRNLTFVLPNFANIISKSTRIDTTQLIPPPEGRLYDVMCNHVPYNRTAFEELIPSDSLYAGIVRNPVTQLTSYLNYYFGTVMVENKFQDFIQNVNKYTQMGVPLNPMAEYFGLPPADGQNVANIEKFLHKIDREFDIVLVLEKLDESLVLMKRLFCWSFADIVYTSLNENPSYTRFDISEQETIAHDRISVADYMLYRWFQQKLSREILNGGEDFTEELALFRNVLATVWEFCPRAREEKYSSLYITGSSWSPAFNITSQRCSMMMERELKFQESVGERQYGIGWKFLRTPYPPGVII